MPSPPLYSGRMAELIVALLTWISAQTGLATPPPPSVAVLSKEQMSERAYNRKWQPTDDVPAAYDRDAGVIYLRDDWNPADLRSRARLVHELAHHVQMFHGLAYHCPASREPEAYGLALKWLEEQGAGDPHAVLGIDEFSIWILSRCPDEG